MVEEERGWGCVMMAVYSYLLLHAAKRHFLDGPSIAKPINS